MVNDRSAEVPEVVRAAWLALDQTLGQTLSPQDPALRRYMTVVRNWLHGDELPASALDEDRIAPVRASVPVVYAWSTGTFGVEDESWVAVCEDGELMAAHVSSGRAFGLSDVHLSFDGVAARYREKFGGLGNEFYVFVVVPEGKRPPAEVMAANAAWAAKG